MDDRAGITATDVQPFPATGDVYAEDEFLTAPAVAPLVRVAPAFTLVEAVVYSDSMEDLIDDLRQ